MVARGESNESNKTVMRGNKTVTRVTPGCVPVEMPLHWVKISVKLASRRQLLYSVALLPRDRGHFTPTLSIALTTPFSFSFISFLTFLALCDDRGGASILLTLVGTLFLTFLRGLIRYIYIPI